MRLKSLWPVAQPRLVRFSSLLGRRCIPGIRCVNRCNPASVWMRRKIVELALQCYPQLLLVNRGYCNCIIVRILLGQLASKMRFKLRKKLLIMRLHVSKFMLVCSHRLRVLSLEFHYGLRIIKKVLSVHNRKDDTNRRCDDNPSGNTIVDLDGTSDAKNTNHGNRDQECKPCVNGNDLSCLHFLANS